MPLRPGLGVPFAPLMLKLRMVTTTLAPFTMIPLAPADRIEAMVPAPSIVIDLVVVTTP